MDFNTVHVDQMGLQVRAAEEDKDVVGLAWVVASNASGIDARLGPDACRPQHGGEKTHGEREMEFLHSLSPLPAAAIIPLRAFGLPLSSRGPYGSPPAGLPLSDAPEPGSGRTTGSPYRSGDRDLWV